MSLPPSIVDVRFAHPGGRQRRLWLPLFLLWPVLAILAFLALGIALVADALLSVAGRHQPRWTGLLAGAIEALAEARGLQIKVDGTGTTIDVVVR